MTLKLESISKWTLKRLKVGIVSSFHPHSICKKVERLKTKTGCTSCTKRTISFEVSGFHTETRLLQRDSIFLNLFEIHSFSVFKMHHSKPHHQFSTLSDFICYFPCIYWFFWATRPWNWKALQMNYEKVKSWHGIIIHPHSMCKRVERLTAKTGFTSCTKRTIYFEVSGFHTETRLLQRDFNFWTYLNSILFLCSKCTIQSHIINFQPFLTSFVIFHAFTDYFEL